MLNYFIKGSGKLQPVHVELVARSKAEWGKKDLVDRRASRRWALKAPPKLLMYLGLI